MLNNRLIDYTLLIKMKFLNVTDPWKLPIVLLGTIWPPTIWEKLTIQTSQNMLLSVSLVTKDAIVLNLVMFAKDVKSMMELGIMILYKMHVSLVDKKIRAMIWHTVKLVLGMLIFYNLFVNLVWKEVLMMSPTY